MTADGPGGPSSAWRLRVWDLETGRALREFSHPHPVGALRVSPDASRLAVVDEERVLTLYDLQTGRALMRRETGQPLINRPTFSADGTRLLTLGRPQGELWVLAAATGRHLGRLTNAGDPLASTGQFPISADGRHVAAADWGCDVVTWRRTGPDSPWGVTGSPPLLTLAGCTVLTGLSLWRDARRRGRVDPRARPASTPRALAAFGSAALTLPLAWAALGKWDTAGWDYQWLVCAWAACLPLGLGLATNGRGWKIVSALALPAGAALAAFLLDALLRRPARSMRVFDRWWAPAEVGMTYVLGGWAVLSLLLLVMVYWRRRRNPGGAGASNVT